MGLEWYATPGVSNMMFDCGGIEYTACPFNGWFLGTEVGARDLCDVNRYNLLPVIETFFPKGKSPLVFNIAYSLSQKKKAHSTTLSSSQ